MIKSPDDEYSDDLEKQIKKLTDERDALKAALEEAVAGMGGSYAIWSVKAKEALASIKPLVAEE